MHIGCEKKLWCALKKPNFPFGVGLREMMYYLEVV